MEWNRKKKNVYVSHDIEKAGSQYKHPVVSLGLCIGDGFGNILHKERINFKVRWFEDFEQRAVDQFWSKLSDAVMKNFFVPAPLSELEGWTRVRDYLDTLEKDYPESEYNIVFLTDDPSFDTATIDYNLEKHFQRLPMRYSSTGQYRSLRVVDELFDTLPMKTREKFKPSVIADHSPDNDAEFLYRQFIFYQSYSDNSN